jgi:hypothetical protein
VGKNGGIWLGLGRDPVSKQVSRWSAICSQASGLGAQHIHSPHAAREIISWQGAPPDRMISVVRAGPLP